MGEGIWRPLDIVTADPTSEGAEEITDSVRSSESGWSRASERYACLIRLGPLLVDKVLSSSSLEEMVCVR